MCSSDLQVLGHDSFKDIDIVLASAGADRSREFAPSAVKAGAVVIDNSSAFRMDPAIPLVVPEVNPRAVSRHKGIIANPNCSTIQMVVALKPIHDKAKIKRIVVSTYQAVGGAGQKGIDELEAQTPIVLSGQKAMAEKIEQKRTRQEKENARKLELRATKAANWKPFADACKAKGLDPAETFKKYYEILSKNPEFGTKFFDARMDAGNAKKSFSETGFYANYIMQNVLRRIKKQ